MGIRKASLYSHFESKQAILDTLVNEVLQQYAAHSIFARAEWEEDIADLPLLSDAVVQRIQGQLRYILHDPMIQRARKMLVITKLFGESKKSRECNLGMHAICDEQETAEMVPIRMVTGFL